jgi:hypothetical protein
MVRPLFISSRRIARWPDPLEQRRRRREKKIDLLCAESGLPRDEVRSAIIGWKWNAKALRLMLQRMAFERDLTQAAKNFVARISG